MNLIESIKSIEQISNMGVADKIAAGLLVAVIGMGITFIVLMILWLMIALMSNIQKLLSKDKVQRAKELGHEKLTIPSEENDLIKRDDAGSIDAGVVAAITAAIQFSLEHKSFQIKHISRRIEDGVQWRQEESDPWK